MSLYVFAYFVFLLIQDQSFPVKRISNGRPQLMHKWLAAVDFEAILLIFMSLSTSQLDSIIFGL